MPKELFHQLHCLTHWGWDEIDATLQMTFWNAFSWLKIVYEWNFTEVYSQESSQQYSSIGSDNGLAPARRQAIIWTNDG